MINKLWSFTAKKLVFEGVSNTQSIPRAIYHEEGVSNTPQSISRAISHEERNANESETLSEFDNISIINMLSIPFTYNRQDCVKDMNQEKYISFRTWFFSTYSQEEQQHYKTQFYNHIDCIKQLISFPIWFIEQATIDNSHFLHVLQDFRKKWTTAKGDTISAIHPPSELLKLRSGDTIIESVAFSPHEKQLNFTNLTLQTICSQLNRIEEKGPIIVPKETADIAKKELNLLLFLSIQRRLLQKLRR